VTLRLSLRGLLRRSIELGEDSLHCGAQECSLPNIDNDRNH
jgi:hypothetical protein